MRPGGPSSRREPRGTAALLRSARRALVALVATTAGTVVFAGLASVAVVLATSQPVLMPAFLAFLAWGGFNARGWMVTTRRLRRSRRLYDFARLLEASPDSQGETSAVLSEIKRILSARYVELILPGTIDRTESVVLSTDADPAVVTLDDRSLAALAGDLGPTVHVVGRRSRTDPDLARRHARELLLAPVHANPDRVHGLLTIVDRVGPVRRFTGEDQSLVQTLASHLGLWLERSALSGRLGEELRLREYQALHDDLTSLPNRRGLAEASSELLTRPPAPGTVTALALIDLNRFKDINDTLGHTIGDRLLGHVATRLRNSLPRNWIVCRIGGDEFVVMAANIASTDVLGRTVRDVLRDNYHLDGVEVLVDAAVGIAVVGEHGRDVETLLRHADIAMYEAKRRHLPFRLYAPPELTTNREWLSITAQLDRGIRNHELVVHYQPKIDLVSGIVCGLEALVRWQHPNGELVPPNTFIPLAEDSGLAGPLFADVLDQALRQMRAWHLEGLDTRVAVNMSARNLADHRLVATVADVIRRHGTPRDYLTLELTETAAVTNHDAAISSLTALRTLGVRSSLDDFGTGNSPLRLLHDLPIDELKIDRSFVGAMSADPNGRHIVANLVQLARDLGKSIVAEGVEDATIHGLLVGMGCDIGQGYHYARPASGPAITMWLREHFLNAGLDRPVVTGAACSFGLYAVLGVTSDASRLEITRAYAAAAHRAAAGGSATTVHALRTAFEVLSSPTMRGRHDREHGAVVESSTHEPRAERPTHPRRSGRRPLPQAPTALLAASGGASTPDEADAPVSVPARAFGLTTASPPGRTRSA